LDEEDEEILGRIHDEIGRERREKEAAIAALKATTDGERRS
jgi:hypothetical protein